MTRILASLVVGVLAIVACTSTPAEDALGEPSPIPDAPVVEGRAAPSEVPQVALIATPVPAAHTQPPATPTPTPDPNIWRVEGVVLDDNSRPLPDVCIAIGPNGCREFSPHTDGRGVFSFDVPQNPTVFYDLHFVKDGYERSWIRVKPEGPSVFNLALRRVEAAAPPAVDPRQLSY